MTEGTSVVLLRDWIAIACSDDDLVLFGTIFGHHRIKDGETVRVRNIANINGKYFTTIKGTLYHLDNPIQEFIAGIEKQGYVFDPENPLEHPIKS